MQLEQKLLRRFSCYQTKARLKLRGECSLNNLKHMMWKIKNIWIGLWMFPRGATIWLVSVWYSTTGNQWGKKTDEGGCKLFHLLLMFLLLRKEKKKKETRTQNPKIGQTCCIVACGKLGVHTVVTTSNLKHYCSASYLEHATPLRASLLLYMV